MRVVSEKTSLFRAGLFALALGPVLLLSSCGDGNPVLFPVPAEVEVEGSLQFTGEVAREVQNLPTFRLVDSRGNPAPGVEVQFRVETGGGGVSPQTAVSDASGRARLDRWQLGQTAGLNVVVADLGELGEFRIEAEGLPGPPDRIVAASPVQQNADVATQAPENPVARLTDRFGNGLAGYQIQFQPLENSGTVEDTLVVTDEDGSASAGTWSLGTKSGNQTVLAHAVETDDFVEPRQFVVQARPGPAVDMVAASPTMQAAAAGTDVLDPPVVRFLDEYGNGVPGQTARFAVTVGGGSISADSAVSVGDGRAILSRWTLGPELGMNEVVASSAEFPDVVFQAEGTDASLVLTIDQVQLNQANQRADGSIGGVASRPGLLRVVARANESNSVETDVLIRLFQGTTLIREERVSRSESGIPVEPNLASAAQTWNLVLPAGDVIPGLSVQAVLDPDEEVDVASRAGHTYPQEGGTRDLDVEPIPILRVHFIPVRLTRRNNATGNVTESNAADYLTATRRWIPTEAMVHTVDGAFTSDADLTEHDDWVSLLSDLNAKRTAEDASDEYYHGIVPRFSGIRYAGIAYVNSSPSGTRRTAISWDALPGAAGTVAHELGHNMGRRHSPSDPNNPSACQTPSGVDLDYPYPNGIIGQPGYDIVGNQLIHPTQNYDYMGYCSPRWTSDYTYGALVSWRRADPYATFAEEVLVAAASAGGTVGASSAGARENGTGLLIWGWTGPQGVVLNPAFNVEAPVQLPESGGPDELRGVAEDGRELFRFSFQGTQVSHGHHGDERHFSFLVPLTTREMESLARIELNSPHGSAVRTLMPADDPDVPGIRDRRDDPRFTLDRLPGDRVRLRWDAEAFPMVMLRDPATGRVSGFLRDGDAEFHDPTRVMDRVEVLLSDGVRSRVGVER